MALSATEQYFLEIVNRARLDPMAESRRQGVDLNAGLAGGTVTTAPKQVLAPNELLESAAVKHSQWMLTADVFSHTGAGGSLPLDRIKASGYALTGSWGYGENLDLKAPPPPQQVDAGTVIAEHFASLFASPNHRPNLLDPRWRETGIGQELGQFTYGYTTFNASVLTQKFAFSGTQVFVTGVAFDDRDGDLFYGLGEGLGAVTIAGGGRSTTTAAAGGYAVGLTASTAAQLTYTMGGVARTVFADVSKGNVKLDLLGNGTFLTSGNLTLGTGATDARVLGIAGLRLTGNADANRLTGASGDDTLDGGAGFDTLTGGAGNDLYIVDTVHDVLVEVAGGGIDTVRSSVTYVLAAEFENLELVGAAVMGTGNAADNRITGNAANNLLFGGAGNDTLQGGAGNDTLDGGTGSDRLEGGTGDDTYIVAQSGVTIIELAGQGFDTVRAQINFTLPDEVEALVLLGSATIGHGNRGANLITGTELNNVLHGEDGNDTLDGRGGDDTMYGGAGDDTFIVGSSRDVVVEYARGGTDTVITLIPTWVLGDEVENLTLQGKGRVGTGNALNNVITGNQRANVLDGGAGNDTITGSANKNRLYGGDGDDVLVGGDSLDKLYGGAGADTLRGGLGDDQYFIDAFDVLQELPGEGIDTVFADFDYRLLDHFEVLRLGVNATSGTGNAAANRIEGSGNENTLSGLDGDDTLKGNGGRDALFGGNGADVMFGGTANDTLYGGTGDDKLYGDDAHDLLWGEAGDDRLFGGIGNDTLKGGTGTDMLFGGTGADVFVLARGDGDDRVADFSLADGDRLQLDAGLWSGILTTAEVISRYGRVSGGNLTLTFGTDSIRLDGFTDTATLAAQIDIF